MALITKNGKKLYPIGKFTTYQHVFYNYNDRMYNKMYDEEHSEEACEAYDESERLLDVFNTNPQDANGIVYVEYNDYKVMKDIIGGYAVRHGGRV